MREGEKRTPQKATHLFLNFAHKRDSRTRAVYTYYRVHRFVHRAPGATFYYPRFSLRGRDEREETDGECERERGT